MLTSPSASRVTLLVAVVPVPPVPPLEVEGVVMVRLLPKIRIGPAGLGMTPVGVSIGEVEGVSTNGKE